MIDMPEIAHITEMAFPVQEEIKEAITRALLDRGIALKRFARDFSEGTDLRYFSTELYEDKRNRAIDLITHLSIHRNSDRNVVVIENVQQIDKRGGLNGSYIKKLGEQVADEILQDHPWLLMEYM